MNWSLSVVTGCAADGDSPQPGRLRTRCVSPRRWSSQQDTLASLMILLLIGLAAISLLILRNRPVPSGMGPATFSQPCTGVPARGLAAQQVERVSAATAPLTIYIGRDGHGQIRQTAPLAVQKGQLCPGQTLTATTTDFTRGDGAGLPAYQIAAWGQVDSTGTHVTMYVSVAPRYQQVSGFGGYSGTVALDYPRVVGANVVVNVHVLYPSYLAVVIFGLLTAFGGFTWSWLVHDLHSSRKDPGAPGANSNQYFWRNFVLRIAILLAAAIPVVNLQFLANPDWEGTASQYIAIATLAGAAALALTPTLRVLALPPNLPPKSTNCGAATNMSCGGEQQKVPCGSTDAETPAPDEAEPSA